MDRGDDLVELLVLRQRATAPAASSASRSSLASDAVRQTTACPGQPPARRRRLGAVQAGQPVVHQTTSGASSRSRRRLAARRRPADDLDVGAQPEQQLERLAERPRCPRRAGSGSDRAGTPSLFRREQQRVVRLAAVVHLDLELRDGARLPASSPVERRLGRPVSSVRTSRGSASSRSTTAPRPRRSRRRRRPARRRRGRARRPSRTATPSSSTSARRP